MTACDPGTPPCNADDDGDGRLSCQEGTRAECLRLCLEPGRAGDACVVDPCEAGTTATVCDVGFTCVGGTEGANGVCEVAPALPLLGCDPDTFLGAPGACSAPTHCASFEDCEDVDVPPWLVRSPAQGMCRLPVREGERCDGSWQNTTEGMVCRACGPGLDCAPAPWDSTIRVCQRPCASDGDCPCYTNPGDGGPACVGNRCRVCLRPQRECSRGNGPACCDGQSECFSVMETTRRRDICCRREGSQCSRDVECCTNARCEAGVCERCGAFPGAPPGPAGCCPGLVLRTPLGQPPVCGRPCPRSERGDICRTDATACGSGEQAFTCDSVLGDVCPDAEEMPWMVGRQCANQAYSLFCGHQVNGVNMCIDDELQCYVDDWSVCRSPDGADHCGIPCQTGMGEVGVFACQEDRQCAPGGWCSRIVGFGGIVGTFCRCCVEPTLPRCWTPTDRGGCLMRE